MPEQNQPFYSQSTEAVLQALDVQTRQGLSHDTVVARRRQYGPNRLRTAQRRSAWVILFAQFKSLVTVLLAVAAALALAFQQWAEGLAIIAVIVVNTLIGFVSEWRAVRSMEALRQIDTSKVRVQRGGQEREIAVQQLVPGDIVLVEGGDIVSADIRLLEANALRVNEAALTGESVPADKAVAPVEAERPIAEQLNMLFKGTTVVQGSAQGVVVATGMQTELGHVAALAEEAEEQATPLERRLDRLGQRLAWIALGIAAGVAGVGLWAGQPTLLMIETAIALGVAAIPEGLPIVATLALARGIWLMAKRHVLINRLPAVETLGATRTICTDKTGTLTENRMVVRRIRTPTRSIPGTKPSPKRPRGVAKPWLPPVKTIRCCAGYSRSGCCVTMHRWLLRLLRLTEQWRAMGTQQRSPSFVPVWPWACNVTSSSKTGRKSGRWLLTPR